MDIELGAGVGGGLLPLTAVRSLQGNTQTAECSVSVARHTHPASICLMTSYKMINRL